MATVVHKTTLEVRYSVNTPEYDPAVWLVNPPSVSTLDNQRVPKKYWKRNGSDVSEMSQVEKDAVDAAAAVVAAAAAAASATPVFGTSRQGAERLEQTSTTSLVYVNKLSLTTDRVPAGRYALGFYSVLSADSSKQSVSARLTLDAITLGETTQKPSSANEFFTFGGSLEVDLTEGVHVIAVDFKSSGSTAFIQRATVSLWRLR